MPKWIKWTLVAALLALPAAAYAVNRAGVHSSCPLSPLCPCQYK
jgi:hypothetical protein